MAGSRIAGITIELNGNTTKLQDSLKDVNKSLKNTSAELRDVNKLLKLDPKNAELLRQKQELLSKAIADTKIKLDKEKQALEQLKNSDATGKTKEQQERLTREIIETEKNLEKLETEYKSFGKTGVSAADQAADKMKELGSNMKAVGDKMVSVGKDLSTKVTAPIVAVGAASMAAWKQVDDALDTVTIKTGASGKALEDLQQRVKNIATSIPTSFEKAGIAIGEVNTRFGLVGDELKKLSAQFIKFSDINGIDLNNSIDSVQKAMDAFGLSANDAGAFLDTLNQVEQETGVSMDTLVSLMVSNAAALQSMGMNAADAAHLLGDLEKAGIDTSTVMTGFNKIQTKAMTEGISMQQAFNKALSSSESAIDYFGSKAGPKLYKAFQNGTLSADMFRGGVNDLNDALGNLDKTYDATIDPSDKLTIALNNLMLVGHDLGEVMQKELAPIIEEITKLLSDFKDWFVSLDDNTKQMIVRCAAVVAAVGPVLVILGSVISAVGSIASGISGLIKLGGGVVGFFTGTSGAAAGTAAATTAATGSATALSGAMAGLSALALPLTAAIAGVASAALMVSAYWDELGETFQAVGQLIKAQINLFVADFNMLVAKGKVAFNQFASDMKSKITEGMSAVRTTIATGFSAAQTLINTFASSARNSIQTAWSNITSRTAGAMTTLKSNVSNTFNSLRSDVSNTMNNLKANIESAWSNLRNNLESNNNGIKSNITTAWNTLQSDVSKAARDLKNDVDTAFGNLKTNVSKSWNDLKTDSSSVWSTIVNNIKKAVGDIATAVSNTTLKFGKVTIPTFSWSGTNNSEKGTTASIKVSSKEVSYASAMASGAILDRPTIFGALDGNLLRAGEAGKEVIIGANSLSSMIRQSATNTVLNATVANILGLLTEYLPETANQNIVLDSGKLVGALTPAINRQFGMMIRG